MSYTNAKNSALMGRLVIAGTVILLAVSFLLWRNSLRMKSENAQLQEQLASMNQQLAALRSKPVLEQSKPEAAAPVSGETADAQPVVETVQPPAPPAAPIPPPPPPPSITLEETEVTATENGLRTTLSFKPDNDTPLGDLFVAVRLPGGAERIQSIDFSPADALVQYLTRVSDSGDFAAARGQARTMDRVTLTIEVSGPAELDVRGTCGIGPMSLVVSSSDAVVGPPK